MQKGQRRALSDENDDRLLSTRLNELDNKALEIEAERRIMVEKGMRSTNPMDLVRANNEVNKLYGSTEEDQKSYTFDFTDIYSGMGYKDKPTDLSYDIMRQMARVPIVRSAIGTRLSQIENFAQVSTDDNSMGWRIQKKKSPTDTERSDPTDQDKRAIEDLSNFLINMGNDEKDNLTRDTFPSFLTKATKDSLELDQSTFEVISNRRGVPQRFLATDGATYRFAEPYVNPELDKRELVNGEPPLYVQLYEGRPVTDFYAWELSFGVRNKSTDVRNNGYGISELEDLVKIVTWMLNGDDYNGKFFSQGAAPKGILKVMGNVNQNSLNQFRRMWQGMTAGVQNAWRTPVLEGDKIEWIDLQKSNQDMQFQIWQEYLVKLVCAIFRIDPTELGFHMKSGGGSNKGGGDAHSQKQKTNYSKDKGLYPLLQFLQSRINRYIINRLNPKYEFIFTGLSPEDEKESLENDMKRVTNWMTVDEIREKRGLPPLPDKRGDIILNPVYMQNQQMAMMGGDESNQAVDESENTYEDNPFGGGGADEAEKANESNPFYTELEEWVKKGMKPELEGELVL